ncbi:GNAT family N-acetyltransferase [Paenibacillus sp. NFR01]|uniref:GNAT family N-acetyltransferase n=1 Tax=Paenibacillus sp. NFR01 TaxID=1566279 RepID=UPI0008B81CFE|nr:GNAT family N-acetyltransferase [Paenibacillus sp. NFR01]SET11031.1 Ribosomal protein S18 acetylase RimI [Paenibacillus sp. NFR01]
MTANITAPTEQVRIVGYDPSYAAALADMWNRSNESWGGGSYQRTEESVRRDMAASSDMHVFLAVAGDEVVGYCSFAHYRNDEGALYVPLLNVRPDYHGHKVGRNLILSAVRKTIEAGWPRLDLFTWAGNTKAVPMYKKCGFFWEKNDDYVHLMNFIPTVLQTEALAPYFAALDWYADSTREIVIQPDGDTERGFDFLNYSWQKGDIALRAEFEKSGRGLTALETPDYEISTEIANHGLVFGSSYPVRYHVKNRSASELTLEVAGQDDKNIRFDLQASLTLAPGEAAILEGEFSIDPIREEQSNKKTHPVVFSKWLIGGKKAEFRIGVAPKFPVKLKTALPSRALHPGLPAEMALNVENNFDVAATFSFELPEEDFLEWSGRSVRFTVPAKGRTVVPVPFTLRAYGLYSRDIEVTAYPEGQEAFTFKSHLAVLMKGLTGRYGGDAGEQWVAVNGAYSLHYNKNDNAMWLEYPGSIHSFWWAFPKLGKPFSEELSKKKPKDMKIYSDQECQVLEATHDLDEFPGVELKSLVRLSANGVAEFNNEIRNTGTTKLDELFLMVNFGFYGSRLIMPYQGRFIDMGDKYASDPGHWDSSKLTENWLYCLESTGNCGVSWDPALKLQRPEYTLGLEQSLGVLAPGESVSTKGIVFALNTFRTWSDFRAFARKQQVDVIPVLDPHLDLSLGDGNLFAADGVQAVLSERKMMPLSGKLELYVQAAGSGEQKAGELTVLAEQEAQAASLPVYADGGEGARRLRMVYLGEERIQERTALWFPQNGTPVTFETAEGPAGTEYRAGNGVLSIAAAPGFGDSVHSLKYKGQEWLDTSYPKAGPRSWWNPWHGGLGIGVHGMSPYSRHKELKTASWTEQTDVYGNVWKGIRLSMSIEQHEANRGITVHQHYLMLPGVPVLCRLNSITNEAGAVWPYFVFSEVGYFQPSPVFSEGWMEAPNQGRFPAGKVEADFDTKGLFRLGANGRKDLLQIVNHYPNQKATAYLNNKVYNYGIDHPLTLRSGETVWTQPTFMVMGDIPLELEDIHGLLKVSFVQN